MNIKEALEKGILIKESKDINKSRKSLEIANDKLNEAKSLLNVNKYDPCIIFLEDFYSNKIGRNLIYEFDRLRKERHDLLYGLEKEKISEESAKHTLIISEKFIKKIEELLWN